MMLLEKVGKLSQFSTSPQTGGEPQPIWILVPNPSPEPAGIAQLKMGNALF